MRIQTTKDLTDLRRVQWARRSLWVAIASSLVLTTLAAPERYAMLAADVYGYGTALTDQGLSYRVFATYFTFIEVLTSVSLIGVASLIAWRKADDWFALLIAGIFAFLGVLLPLMDGLIAASAAWQPVVVVLRILVYTGLFSMLCLFPDGRFVPTWSRWYLLAWILFVLIFWRSVSSTLSEMAIIPETRTLADGLALLVASIWASAGFFFQFIRYRGYASAEQRQQTKWVLYGFLILNGSSLANALCLTLFPTLRESAHNNLLYTLSMGTLLLMAGISLAITVAVAILRYRLWDIDVLLNRTLVYGSLTGITLGLYILIVGGVGSLLQSRSSTPISFVATGFVAVLFQPLRVRLQTAVDRLMYGQRDDPVGMLTNLARQLEMVDSPEGILPTLVETVATALKLPSVALWLPQNETQWEVAAVHGTQADDLLMIPLLHRSQEIGRLFVAPRGPGERFSREDEGLLSTIAQLCATTVLAVQLTEEVQRSRQALVNSREEERRRLRRDLHDGLGPVLASVALQADTARDLVEVDPAETQAILDSIVQQAQTAVSDVRRLVYGLRPPALDELRLAGALQRFVQTFQHQIQVDFECTDLPLLPAAVEVAAYRIVQEAMNNVVKHAQASCCRIVLSADDHLRLLIEDNGVGLRAAEFSGVGAISMRERAAELGGICTIRPRENGGTRVEALLPLPTEEHA